MMFGWLNFILNRFFSVIRARFRSAILDLLRFSCAQLSSDRVMEKVKGDFSLI